MAMNVINVKVAVNDEAWAAFMDAVQESGSKCEVVREAILEWLRENGYL